MKNFPRNFCRVGNFSRQDLVFPENFGRDCFEFFRQDVARNYDSYDSYNSYDSYDSYDSSMFYVL
jgi:hypothetical protein